MKRYAFPAFLFGSSTVFTWASITMWQVVRPTWESVTISICLGLCAVLLALLAIILCTEPQPYEAPRADRR